MLYKKYHRNFVRQFKVGVRFNYYLITQLSYTVVREPQYSISNHCIEFLSNRNNTRLVYLDGRINKYINVIQEIS